MNKKLERLVISASKVMKKASVGAAVSVISLTTLQAEVEDAKRAFDAREYQKTIDYLKTDLASDQTVFVASFYTGRAHLNLGNHKKAIEYLKQATEVNPENADAHYFLALANGERAENAGIFSAMGHIKDAKKSFEKVVSLDPTHIDGREALVDFYAMAPGMVGGDKEKAFEHAAALKELDRSRGLIAEARVHEMKGKKERAIELYGQAIAEFPSNHGAYYARGLMYREDRNYDGAFSDFEALASSSGPTSISANEVQDMQSLGKYFYGSVASRSLTNIDTGIQMLEEYLNDGIFTEDFRKGYAEYYLATLYAEQGNFDHARQLAKTAVTSSDSSSLRKLVKKFNKRLKKLVKVRSG